jgi:hypothetical protein
VPERVLIAGRQGGKTAAQMRDLAREIERLEMQAKTLRTALKAVDGCCARQDDRKYLNYIAGDEKGCQAVLIDGATWKRMQDALNLTKDLK